MVISENFLEGEIDLNDYENKIYGIYYKTDIKENPKIIDRLVLILSGYSLIRNN